MTDTSTEAIERFIPCNDVYCLSGKSFDTEICGHGGFICPRCETLLAVTAQRDKLLGDVQVQGRNIKQLREHRDSLLQRIADLED